MSILLNVEVIVLTWTDLPGDVGDVGDATSPCSIVLFGKFYNIFIPFGILQNIVCFFVVIGLFFNNHGL